METSVSGQLVGSSKALVRMPGVEFNSHFVARRCDILGLKSVPANIHATVWACLKKGCKTGCYLLMSCCCRSRSRLVQMPADTVREANLRTYAEWS